MMDTPLPRRVEIRKGKDGFGFNLGKSAGRHFLKKVDEGDAAYLAGARTSDRILAVNDVSVVNKKHGELVQFIKAGGDNLSMILLASEHQMAMPNNTELLHVTRNENGFGFNLGRKGEIHYFKGVDSRSAAEQAGATPNALVFEVNSVAITGLTHGDVVKLIKAGGETVAFRVVPDVGGQNMAFLQQSAAIAAQRKQMLALAEARVQAEKEERKRLEEMHRVEAEIEKLKSKLSMIRLDVDTASVDKNRTISRLTAMEQQVEKIALASELEEMENAMKPVVEKAVMDLKDRVAQLRKKNSNDNNTNINSELKDLEESILELTVELDEVKTSQRLAELRQAELVKLEAAAMRRRKFEMTPESHKQGGHEAFAQGKMKRLKDLSQLASRKHIFDEEVRQKEALEAAKRQEAADRQAIKDREKKGRDEALLKLDKHREATRQRHLDLTKKGNERRKDLVVGYFKKMDAQQNGRISQQDLEDPAILAVLAELMEDKIEIFDLKVEDFIHEVVDKPLLSFKKAVNRKATENEIDRKAAKIKRDEEGLMKHFSKENSEVPD